MKKAWVFSFLGLSEVSCGVKAWVFVSRTIRSFVWRKKPGFSFLGLFEAKRKKLATFFYNFDTEELDSATTFRAIVG